MIDSFDSSLQIEYEQWKQKMFPRYNFCLKYNLK